MAATQLTDLQIPANWMQYIQVLSSDKSPLVESGVLVRDERIDERMMGGGLLINIPHFRDLADAAENVSDDDPTSSATPTAITTGLEIGVRLSRNQAFSSMDLNAALIGTDPMAAIEAMTGGYWRKRLQAATIATIAGVLANNAKSAPGGGATQNDMTVNVSGSSFVDNVTNFTAEAFIDATHTMSDAQEELGILLVHPVVHARMLKADLIDFKPDSEGKMSVEVFQGRRVIVSRGMPSPSTGVYDSWIVGPGAIAWGLGTPKVPAETDRIPLAGDGGGQDVLVQRVEWVLHPRGHAFVITDGAEGGPTNAATAKMLAHEDSWQRRYAERPLVRIARLRTREA